MSKTENSADRRNGTIGGMEAVFGTDAERIEHALKVLDFAETILAREPACREVVVAAAILHDIGMHEAERKHGSTAGRSQEVEGPPIARGIMERLGFAEDVIDHVCRIIARPKRSEARVWLMFSGVFFAQLVLGLLGAERFLMTGNLHLPVPAVILAGPLCRGEGFFMLILFLCTVLIVDPAWCGWLCYIGAWDNVAASARRPRKARHHAAVRVGIMATFSQGGRTFTEGVKPAGQPS